MAAGATTMKSGTSDTLSAAIINDLLIDGGKDTEVKSTLVTAKPGNTTSGTPISVSSAVTACSGGANSGAGYGVA